jgi:hypothetical protein
MGESDDIVWDKSKGELRILGKRYTALDAQALCDHMDSLVGPTVAEVIIDNHERHLGKEDAAGFRQERPQTTVREIIDLIIKTDLLSGTGVTKITIPEGAMSEGAILVEIWNPSVKTSQGAGKALLLSYWCGALSFLLEGQFEAKDVLFKENENVLTAKIVRREVK